MTAAAELRDRLAALEEELREVDAAFETAMLALPNLPAPRRRRRDARGGRAREHAVVDPPKPEFDFEPRDHLDLARRA